MRHSIQALLLASGALLLTPAVSASQPPQSAAADHRDDAAVGQAIRAHGTIVAIDPESKKVTIAHQPIPSVGWPAMTMRFTVASADINIKALRVGEAVDFTFVQQGALSLLQSITVVPA